MITTNVKLNLKVTRESTQVNKQEVVIAGKRSYNRSIFSLKVGKSVGQLPRTRLILPGKYKVKIDGEWYTVPGTKVVLVDENFCSIKFGGQSINVEKNALIKCDEAKEGTIETDAYEV